MQRLILQQLIEWKNSPHRKPLIMQGTRQVGKTWLLKELGTHYYENLAYFNFDENPEYRQFFTTTKNPARILENLMLAGSCKIAPACTLIVFDEVQDCPEVINSLKYFYENAPEYHIACAGSLLGLTLARPSSFPVGKVNFIKVYPMTFTEFLLANGDEQLVRALDAIASDVACAQSPVQPAAQSSAQTATQSAVQTPLPALPLIPDAFLNPLAEKLKMYYLTGGMPEAVLMWTTYKDIAATERVLQDIIRAYEHDFAKHPKPNQIPKISLIWKSLSSQLARENKKFLYNVVKPGARAREYEDALQWLVDAQLVHKVYRVRAPKIPLSAYDDLSAFKIYASDVGILRALSQLSPQAFTEGSRLFTEFKGALSENFVAQSLITQYAPHLHYWSQTNPPYEVDFLIQEENEIIPIEVKSSLNTQSKSLKKFKERFAESTPIRIRYSLNNLSLDGDMLNIPLVMADYTKRLVEALRKKG